MRELINPDPHEMYRVPYKLDPYQDLNYQCVDDSFDMQVTAGHLKIGPRDGKECVTRVTSYHLESDPKWPSSGPLRTTTPTCLTRALHFLPFVITLTLMVEDREDPERSQPEVHGRRRKAKPPTRSTFRT